MFSELGPLFKTQFRQTEQNDTRQYIPHEERDNNRKKHEEEAQKPPPDEAWVDDASVSVVALRAFLIDFVKTIPGGKDYALINISKPNETISRPKEHKRPTSTHNARAVRAYQTMAAHAQEPTKPQANFSDRNNDPTADKLESQELRDVHHLIIDLEAIEQRGVTTLHIQKANSFVESLKQAIALEKLKF